MPILLQKAMSLRHKGSFLLLLNETSLHQVPVIIIERCTEYSLLVKHNRLHHKNAKGLETAHRIMSYWS